MNENNEKALGCLFNAVAIIFVGSLIIGSVVSFISILPVALVGWLCTSVIIFIIMLILKFLNKD